MADTFFDNMDTDEEKDSPDTILSSLSSISPDPRQKKVDAYRATIPHATETLEEMDARLDVIITRIAESVQLKDWESGGGFDFWNRALIRHLSIPAYPIPLHLRISLISLYYNLATTPAMASRLVDLFVTSIAHLLSTGGEDDRLGIRDIELDWRRLWDALQPEVFHKGRKTGKTAIATNLLNLAELTHMFFHPAEIDDMLNKFVPLFDGNDLNRVLSAQACLTHFLPLSHPQKWLPMMFKLSTSFNSSLFSGQMLDLFSRLAFKHLDPAISNPARLSRDYVWPDKESTEDEDDWEETLPLKSNIPPTTSKDSGEMDVEDHWEGIRKDVGIFSEGEFGMIMMWAMQALDVPIAGPDISSLGSGAHQDKNLTSTILTMIKPTERTTSIVHILIYSMSKDATARLGTTGVNTPALDSPVGKKYLAGSKALDALSKLITSIESFFHPSNIGKYTPTIAKFIWLLSVSFLARWKAEERPSCKTPAEYRLTKEIKKEFVLCLRTVALLAMFSKHEPSAMLANACIKQLAILEPDLILKSILDRAYPSLTGLEETHRTTAVLASVGVIGLPLMSRDIYYQGAKHLVPLLELALPGIDMNDPKKTVSTAYMIHNIVQFVPLSDLTDVEVTSSEEVPEWAKAQEETALAQHAAFIASLDNDQEAPEDLLPPQSWSDENTQLRYSTSGLSSWLAEFIQRVIHLAENLPEEGGKSLKTGGKTEQIVTSMIIKSCGTIFLHLSDQLFNQALEDIYQYASTSVRANTVLFIGQLVGSLCKANFEKVFEKFFPLCRRRIKEELENGASSVATTSASLATSSDATLHWYLSILFGMLTYADESLLKYGNDMIDLLKYSQITAKNERSWSVIGKCAYRVLRRLTSIWAPEPKCVNEDEWISEDFKNHGYRLWGKLYKETDVKINWHVPSQEETEFIWKFINQVLVPIVDKLEQVPMSAPTKEWTQQYCRNIAFLKSGLDGLKTFFLEDNTTKNGGTVITDSKTRPEPFKKQLDRLKTGIVLQDANDALYQRFAAFKDRVGALLLSNSAYLRSAGGDDSIDPVLLTLSTISTYLTSQGMERAVYDSVKKNADAVRDSSRLFSKQKVLPRRVWVAKAEWLVAQRLKFVNSGRKRSKLDDALIMRVTELSLSVYRRIRKDAQGALALISSLYDGSKALALPRIFESLAEGTDPDEMKGALYNLAYKHFAQLGLGDARFLNDFIMKVLYTQKQEKPSIQELVAKICEDNIVRLLEPCTLRSSVTNKEVEASCTDLMARSTAQPLEPKVIKEISIAVANSIISRDVAFDKLTVSMLDLAESPSTHWRYLTYASRYLKALIRRDQPLTARMTLFFMGHLIDDQPQVRHYAQLALTKILHFIKLRTLADGSAENLLLGTHANPLKVTYVIPQNDNFTEQYLAAFRTPIRDDDTTTILYDKAQSGWLTWGQELKGYRQAGETNVFKWDTSSQEAIDAFTSYIGDASWWDKLADRYVQEDDRTYLSADTINLIKSLCQILGNLPFDQARPIMDKLLDDKDSDRHKQRALAEMLSGIIRGSKHWTAPARRKLWEWLTPALDKIYAVIKPDTLSCWQMFFEFNLYRRDPRRLQPMVNFVIAKGKAVDFGTGFAFEATKSLTLLKGLVKCLDWRFDAWKGDFVDLYQDHLGDDFAEVRSILADALHLLDKISWRICYPNPALFVEDCHTHKDVMKTHRATALPRLLKYLSSLQEWRAHRPSGPLGPTSTYDKASLGLLKFLTAALSDVNCYSAFDYVLPLLPEIFQMRELRDSEELQAQASIVLFLTAGVSCPTETVKPLLLTLVSSLKANKSWRIRLHLIPVLSVVYFRGLPVVTEDVAAQTMEALTECLNDENLEVREAASQALSAVLRCSQRESIVLLKIRFEKIIRQTKLPPRRQPNGEASPDYPAAVIKLHSAVLGVGSIIEAFPYTLPKYIPSLIADTLAPHASQPSPIGSTIQKIAANFKTSHQDTWEAEHKRKFNEDQLMELQALLTGTSYYA